MSRSICILHRRIITLGIRNILTSFVARTLNENRAKQVTVGSNGIATKHTEEPKSVYEHKLEEYFKNGEFEFKGETQVKDLKRWMETVYLRKKLLVAIDIEAWERNANKVTEIGLAIYNPKELQNSILPIIKQFHIIVEEHQRMFNGRYCPNNKHNFMGGISYTLNLAESKKFIESIILRYIRDNGEDIVLVGHHIEGDLKWLRNIGVQFPQETPIIDTARIYRLTYESGGSLRGILRLVGIPHGYLHNAANDAYYTLLASLAYCDPSVRIEKKLDVYHPQLMTASHPSKKHIKRRERLYDTSTSIQHSNGTALYHELFPETSSEISNKTEKRVPTTL